MGPVCFWEELYRPCVALASGCGPGKVQVAVLSNLPAEQDSMPFICRRVRDEADMQAACLVRRRVFIEEQGVPEAEEWDALDELATHFVLLESEAIVGTARLVPQENCWFR